MASTAGVSDEDRHEIWDCWLDGCSISYIRELKVTDHSRAVLKSVLAEEPPESIRNDDRYRHGGRFFWIAAYGPVAPLTGKDFAFVIAKMPNRITNAAYGKGLRAIARDFAGLHPEGSIDIYAVDALDADTALRYVNELGCPGWVLDDKGGIRRMMPSASPEPEQGTSPRP